MSDINVTPMVDVMLVLLIVFMVTAPMMTTGVPVDLPSSDAPSIAREDKDPIEISITTKGEIYIGDSVVGEDRLVAVLTAMMEGKPDQRIFLRADTGLDYGRVMEVLGFLNAAGFSKVALISTSTKN